MASQWMIRGVEYSNCNCNYGCPCQFNAPTTYGNCEGLAAGYVEEGNHGETRLDGLNWVMMFWWPGEIAGGNGRLQVVIDERADDAQREIDVDGRTAHLNVPGLVESTGSPIINPFSGEPHRARINLADGFEYTLAEMGSASSKLTGGIELELTDSHSHFNILHMNQDGVIR